MKYKLPETRPKKNCVIAGYVFVNGFCEVTYPSIMLEKYYKCTVVVEDTIAEDKPKRRGRKPKQVDNDGISS